MYTQITDFTDFVTAPALSPDGRMVVFIRGGDAFLSRGQIYVKALPHGQPVQLTTSENRKFAPVFTPDGSRVAYTEVSLVGNDTVWETWTVPVFGGEPSRFLPNASGLVWLDSLNVIFSEFRGNGGHLGIVTATNARASERAIYFPAHERGMAHYSYASPNRQAVLVVEMDRAGRFSRAASSRSMAVHPASWLGPRVTADRPPGRPTESGCISLPTSPAIRICGVKPTEKSRRSRSRSVQRKRKECRLRRTDVR